MLSGRDRQQQGSSNRTMYIIGAAVAVFVLYFVFSSRTGSATSNAPLTSGSAPANAAAAPAPAAPIAVIGSGPGCAVNHIPQRLPAAYPSPFAFDHTAFVRDHSYISIGRISAEACPSYRMSVFPASAGWSVVKGDGTLSGGPDPHGYIAQYTPFVAHLKAHEIVLDIGANIGLSMLPMAALGMVVVGFEPSTKNVLKLKQSIILNGMVNAAVVHAAVGNPSAAGQTIPIYVPTDGEDNTSLHPDVANANVKGVSVKEDVALVGIDMWFEQNKNYADVSEVRFAKVDVQGFELGVMQGMEKTLKLNGPKGFVIQAEFAPRLIRKGGGNPRELLEFMHECGYKGRPMWSRGGQYIAPADFDEVANDDKFVDDLVFVWRGDA